MSAGSWVVLLIIGDMESCSDKNGRPEWTRTIDLFRVKEAL